MGVSTRFALVVIAALGVSHSAQAQSASPADDEGPTVHLVTSDPRARLQVRRDERWTSVCEAPCDMPLDAALEYRVGGHALRSTAPFRLPGQGPLTLDAHVTTLARMIVGASITGVGALGVLVGGTYLLVGNLVAPTTSNGGPCNQADRDTWKVVWSTLGGVFLGVGVALVIPGIILLAGAHSSVDVRGSTSAVRWTPAGLTF